LIGDAQNQANGYKGEKYVHPNRDAEESPDRQRPSKKILHGSTRRLACLLNFAILAFAFKGRNPAVARVIRWNARKISPLVKGKGKPDKSNHEKSDEFISWFSLFELSYFMISNSVSS
jgi:hypothetical protein